MSFSVAVVFFASLMIRSTSFDQKVIFEFDPQLGLWAGASFDKGKTWDTVDTDREQPNLKWDEETDFTDLSESHSFLVPENLLQYLDTRVAHYGLTVPRWVFFNGFDHGQCSIHPEAFRAVLAHLRPMYSSPELLGQTVGFFAWQCEYKFDKALDRLSGEWYDTDEFNNPLAQPPSLVKEHFGDCEDMSRLMQLTFDKLCASRLLDTWTQKYYCFSVDVVIRESQLHQCVILVPKATVHHIWLNGYEVKTPADIPADDVNKFPVLVLESTERTLTNFKTEPSVLMDKLADDNLPDKIAFPYPGKAYFRERYFTTFLTAYCQELHRLSGVASWHLITEHTGVLGVSLDDLVGQRNVVMAPWQHSNPISLKKCDKFFNKYTARLYDIPAPPSSSVETKQSSLDEVIPIYTFADVKREEVEQWSKSKCIYSKPEVLRGVGLRDLYVWYLPTEPNTNSLK